MKHGKPITIAILALTLTATGGVVAQAQSGGPDRQMMREAIKAQYRSGGHRGGWGRADGVFRTLFDAVDADGDRTVTRAEIDAYRAAKLAQADASGDGALSIDEFDTLYREITRSRMVDAFQELDADGDGAIAAAEIDRRIARLIERMDRDGDGALTLQRPGQDDRDE